MDNRITIAQNRHFRTGIIIRQGEGRYYLADGEELIFGVKRFAYNSDYILVKTIVRSDYDENADVYPLELSCSETDLEQGTYYYDVALRRVNGELEKIIGCTELEVKKSVVRSEE